ncbi:hypothetical protein [Burkholderia multivorans]|uniref:hypothetical protein n=1 Tax=Burkholderia multivorans TaxID=87883 RepID=UPI00143ECA53|nr:hypothetical protein [Burkholderia multivorans]QIX16388.1 hypothetical protein FOB32_16345 [Burkholderia multivorans]
MTDPNHDIVPTLRMFDGVMTGLAADEIERLRKRVAELEADAEAEAREPHSDDVAVDSFATAMKHKLALARAKGRGGWETCSPADLSRMLREHVEKGDPRDVANFCMMLWHHGSPIASAPADSEAARLTDEQRRVLVEVAQTFKGTDRRRAVLNELAGVAAPQPAQAETPCKCRRVGDWRGFHHPLCDASTPAQADARVGLTDEQLRNALSSAWNLGQTYWQQADSEYASQHRKSDATRDKYLALVEETCALLKGANHAE